MTELRCGNCDQWIGEAAQEVVFVEHVAHGTETAVPRPRDLRRCKACNRVNVFVAKSDLARCLAGVVD